MSKSDIEAEIQALDKRLKTAAPYAIDSLTAQRNVWVKRLEEYREPKVKTPIVKELPEPEHKQHKGKQPNQMR